MDDVEDEFSMNIITSSRSLCPSPKFLLDESFQEGSCAADRKSWLQARREQLKNEQLAFTLVVDPF